MILSKDYITFTDLEESYYTFQLFDGNKKIKEYRILFKNPSFTIYLDGIKPGNYTIHLLNEKNQTDVEIKKLIC